MLKFNVEQGSDEWHEARAGKITASNFTECRTRLKSGARKGQHTQKAMDYAYRLAWERITGRVMGADQFDTWAMKRGRALEPRARIAHEEVIDRIVESVGFACTNDERFGASADGLIGDDGGAEYKCFEDPAKVAAIRLSNDISECMDQVQGCMWITERAWWHFCLYSPDLPREQSLAVFHVERDQAYIDEMVADMEEFDRLVEDFVAQERARPAGIVHIGKNGLPVSSGGFSL